MQLIHVSALMLSWIFHQMQLFMNIIENLFCLFFNHQFISVNAIFVVLENVTLLGWWLKHKYKSLVLCFVFLIYLMLAISSITKLVSCANLIAASSPMNSSTVHNLNCTKEAIKLILLHMKIHKAHEIFFMLRFLLFFQEDNTRKFTKQRQRLKLKEVILLFWFNVGNKQ